MRLVVILAVVCLAGCASDKLAEAPPAGVDFSGRWKLNEADSDNPQRLLQAQLNAPAAGQRAQPDDGSGGGRGGRGGGRGGGNSGGPGGPAMPSVGALGEGLRWPGKQLEIKQVAAVVAFTSDGINRICQPTDAAKFRQHKHRPAEDGAAVGRAAPLHSREAPPPLCGWTEKTLIVQRGDPDDDHPPFEERYSLSEDGQRLIEVVGFKGGRSSGFTMSRVWDRSSQ
jgi:hypothetical protein